MAQVENPIAEYKKWKQQGESLRNQARRMMEARFKELLTEAAHLAAEYHADFGMALKPPPQITAFRVAAGPSKSKPKTGQAPAAATPTAAPTIEAKPSPKLAALEKKLLTAKKKLDAAKAGGGPTKVLEDRVYELEDDLRLARSAGD